MLQWWMQKRPVILYYVWYTFLCLNIGTAMYLAWTAKEAGAGEEVRGTLIWLAVWAAVSYCYVMYWSKYRWNNDEYQKLLQRRLGRTGRGTTGTSSKEESEEKEVE